MCATAREMVRTVRGGGGKVLISYTKPYDFDPTLWAPCIGALGTVTLVQDSQLYGESFAPYFRFSPYSVLVVKH